MKIGNAVVSLVLRSPLHSVMSGALGIVRYRGRLSQREFSTPTQYVEHGEELLILAGRPETKSWWRNFCTGHDLDYLVRGRWVPYTGQAVVGTDEPDAIAPLLDAYLSRFPKVARSLGDDDEIRRQHAVIVHCRKR